VGLAVTILAFADLGTSFAFAVFRHCETKSELHFSPQGRVPQVSILSSKLALTGG
jgi:hypothetical protein